MNHELMSNAFSTAIINKPWFTVIDHHYPSWIKHNQPLSVIINHYGHIIINHYRYIINYIISINYLLPLSAIIYYHEWLSLTIINYIIYINHSIVHQLEAFLNRLVPGTSRFANCAVRARGLRDVLCSARWRDRGESQTDPLDVRGSGSDRSGSLARLGQLLNSRDNRPAW